MWENKKVTVVFPTFNEEKNIKKAIEDFFSTGIVDEIIVVDNNSTDNTIKEVRKTKARIITEKKQGYGWANRRGMKEAKGDYIITSEPDGTFIGRDIFKMLPFTCDFDVVLGTRTSKELIWKRAKMGLFLRFGNLFLAKLIEYIYNAPCLTDAGCTMKLIKKEALNKIIKKFTIGGSTFSPEFIILAITNKLKCIEVSINYKERVGQSKITPNFWKSFKLGLEMILLILRKSKFTKSRKR